MSETNAESATIRDVLGKAISTAEEILALPELGEYDSSDILAKKQRLLEMKNSVRKRWNTDLIPLQENVEKAQSSILATTAEIEKQRRNLSEDVLRKNDEMMREITTLRSEIADFEEKIGLIQQEIGQLKSQFDASLRASEELKLSLERKEAEKISLQGVLDKLKKEFSNLSADVNSMKTSAELLQANQVLGEKIEQIRTEHDMLLDMLSSEEKRRNPELFEQDELDRLISE